MIRIFAFTHTKASYNTNLAKDYVLLLYTEKTEAVQDLKKYFTKTLEKTKLPQKIKDEIAEKFRTDLLQGRFCYHFRDTSDPEEPQYFGKIHTRYVE